MVVDHSVWMRGGIIQQLCDSLHCGHGALGLCGANGTDGTEHGAVHGPCIIQEDANDLLDQVDIGGVECGAVNGHRCILNLCSILRARPYVG